MDIVSSPVWPDLLDVIPKYSHTGQMIASGIYRDRVLVFNTTFNNISVLSWQSGTSMHSLLA
jgi:hypothetical protein